MSPKTPYKVFHSTSGQLAKSVHIVLVRPEVGGNVGSIARAMQNMGLTSPLRIVGSPDIINDQARTMAKHAGEEFDKALFFSSLKQATESLGNCLKIAATARIGSAHRPHPTQLRDCLPDALKRLSQSQFENIALVFGTESSGLTNEDVAFCDRIATIPSSDKYRSLNLAQAVMIFCYEVNVYLTQPWEAFESAKKTQRERLTDHFIQLAEQVGFILPGDPFKMRPRLERIFSQLPHHIEGVQTLHGLLSQAIRSVKKGSVSYTGRYRQRVESSQQEPN